MEMRTRVPAHPLADLSRIKSIASSGRLACSRANVNLTPSSIIFDYESSLAIQRRPLKPGAGPRQNTALRYKPNIMYTT
jgi:hypothetical protein